MNGLDSDTAYEAEASATVTEENPAPQTGHVENHDTATSSPDPMFPTDRYRLAMPYAERV